MIGSEEMNKRIDMYIEYEEKISRLFEDAHWETCRSPVTRVDLLLMHRGIATGVVEIKMLNNRNVRLVRDAINQTLLYSKNMKVEFVLLCINDYFYFIADDDKKPLIQINEFPLPETYRFLLDGKRMSAEDAVQNIKRIEDSKDERLIELWRNMQEYMKKEYAIVDK